MLQIIFGKVVLVASPAVDRTLGEWLRVNIKFAQAVDYDMGVNVACAIFTIGVGTDQSLMSRKIGLSIFHADGLRPLTSQVVVSVVFRIVADDVMVAFDFIVSVVLVILLIQQFALKNLLNDSYCRDISIKVRSQLDIKRRKGEFIGGYAMYGYCKDERNKSRLVVDEYAAEIVRSIYRRKLEGMSAKVIAEQLNSEGVLAPSEYKRLCGLNYHSGFKAGTHAKWQAIQVLRILKNEVYTGTMVQGKRQKINYKIKKIRDVEESGWIKVPNMHEAIIPQKLFDTVQEVLKLDTCASKGQQTVNLFSGMVRCGGCGQNMVRRTVSKNGKKYVYLHCITNHNGLGCSSHLISESKLAEVVLAALQGKIQQISGLEQRLDEINEIPKNQRRLKSVEEHMKMLEQEEQKYQTLRRQLYEDMSNGIVSKDEYKEFSRSFNEKVENIRKAKAEMNRQLDSLNNLDVEHLPWIEDFKSYQNLTSLNRRVLVELVESITVYDKEHIHIQYRFDQEIRNVLEYCNSIPTTETEGSTV